MLCHRLGRPFDVSGGIGGAQPHRFIEAHPVRDIAVQRIMGRSLIGEHIRRHAARDERRHDVRGVAAQADRTCDAFTPPCINPRQRRVEAVGRLV